MDFERSIYKYARSQFPALSQRDRIKAAAMRGTNLAKTAASDFVCKDMFNTKEAGWMQDVGKNALGLAGAAALVGAANVGLGAVEGAYKSLTEGKQKAKAFGNMMAVHKQLGQEDKSKVQQGFNTLWKFNPDAAQDPLLAGSFVQRTVDYGAVTTDEVSKLVSMRKALRDAEGKESVTGGFGLSNVGQVGI